MYVCMHVCKYACMCVCMYVCMHVCMYVCVYVCMLLACEDSRCNTKRQKMGGPALLWNTLLTAEHPTHRRTPYSLGSILLTIEHHLPRNTLLEAKHPYSLRNTLLTMDLPNGGTSYSPWTCTTWNSTDSTEEELQKYFMEMARSTIIATYRTNWSKSQFYQKTNLFSHS